jgi:two-component system cell cycle response regulator DivK
MAGETILYVDDDQANRILVNRVLRSAGYTMVEAETGMAGVKAAEKSLPDLILMDINLPDIDGYQATDRIRQIPSIANTPVIALTANAMVGDREKALQAGCDGYISKPVDIDLLPRQVAEYIKAFKTEDGTITKEAAPAGSADTTEDAPSSQKATSALDKKRSVLNRRRSALDKASDKPKRSSRPSILGRSRAVLDKKKTDDEASEEGS